MEFSEKKGGPDTKEEQRKRREEVHKLYFDYGYSARKIAGILKKNRGTINRDIMYLHSNIVKKWKGMSLEVLCVIQIEKLELQKTRLRNQLDSVKSFQEKMTIEKIIINIDAKIADLATKLISTDRVFRDAAAIEINKYFEKKKMDKRVILASNFIEVSRDAQKKMDKIYDEDVMF